MLQRGKILPDPEELFLPAHSRGQRSGETGRGNIAPCVAREHFMQRTQSKTTTQLASAA